jgi:hypothetical protein
VVPRDPKGYVIATSHILGTVLLFFFLGLVVGSTILTLATRASLRARETCPEALAILADAAVVLARTSEPWLSDSSLEGIRPFLETELDR